MKILSTEKLAEAIAMQTQLFSLETDISKISNQITFLLERDKGITVSCGIKIIDKSPLEASIQGDQYQRRFIETPVLLPYDGDFKQAYILDELKEVTTLVDNMVSSTTAVRILGLIADEKIAKAKSIRAGLQNLISPFQINIESLNPILEVQT